MAQTLQFLGRLCSGLATGERRSPARSRVQSPHHAPSASLTPPTSPRPPREDPRTLTHRAGTRGPSPSLGLGVRAGGARLTGAGSAMGSGGPTRCPVAPGYRQAKLQATPLRPAGPARARCTLELAGTSAPQRPLRPGGTGAAHSVRTWHLVQAG